MASAATTRVRWALVLLAIASGATDAFAFLLLGGIFTANMTGNLVLLGLFSRPTWLPTAAGAVTAILFFAAAAYSGFRVTRSPSGNSPSAPGAPSRGAGRGLRRIAVAGLVLQALVAVAWPLLQDLHALVVQCALIAVSATALGLQTVLAKRISGAAGLSTTFVTGTLTSLMQELAEGTVGSRSVQLLVVLGLTAGSVAGAALIVLASAAAPALGLTLAAIAVGLLLSARELG